jgi:hypothetical protein
VYTSPGLADRAPTPTPTHTPTPTATQTVGTLKWMGHERVVLHTSAAPALAVCDNKL